MKMTEKDATGYRCCGPDECGSTRTVAGTSEARYRYCIGSLCMAWRWMHPTPDIKIFEVGENDADYVKRRDNILAARKGYCGLAGNCPL